MYSTKAQHTHASPPTTHLPALMAEATLSGNSVSARWFDAAIARLRQEGRTPRAPATAAARVGVRSGAMALGKPYGRTRSSSCRCPGHGDFGRLLSRVVKGGLGLVTDRGGCHGCRAHATPRILRWHGGYISNAGGEHAKRRSRKTNSTAVVLKKSNLRGPSLLHLHDEHPVNPGQGLLHVVSRQLLVASRGGPANGTQESGYRCVFEAVVVGVVCRC